MLYVPEGLAHGYLTLEGETEALYDLGALRGRGRTRSAPGRPRVRHRMGQADPRVMSEKDKAWPDFTR